MWKCMMCETNNADDSEFCLICYTSKDDAKKYYEKLKNFSYLDDYNIKEPKYNSIDKSSPKPKEAPKPVSSPKPTEPVKTSHSLYDDFDDEWIDSIGVSEKKEKMKIVTTFGKGEKVFAFFLAIATSILFGISISNDNPLSNTLGFLLISIVSTYITTRCIPINCSNNILKFFVKLLIFFTVCLVLIMTFPVLSVVCLLFYEIYQM